MEAGKKFSVFEDMGSEASSIDDELFLTFRDWVSPSHVYNWIDNDIVFCIFSDLDITVNYFVFLITLFIFDRFVLYFVLRLVANYLAYSCDIWS